MVIAQMANSDVIEHHLDRDLYCIDTSQTPIIPTRSMTGDELDAHLTNPRYIFVKADLHDEIT